MATQKTEKSNLALFSSPFQEKDMPNAAKLQTKEDLLLLLLRFAWNVIMTFKEDSGARISGWLLSF